MRKGLYRRLAVTNIKTQRRLYVPYILAGTGMAAMFYIMLFLRGSDALANMEGGASIRVVLGFGTIVIASFSIVILLYANGFLMKQRQRELGLYNVLGMEKRHIGRILIWETLLFGLCAIMLGILCGILFSKLMLLLLCHILEAPIPFGFTVSRPGILGTLALFAGIYLLALLYNAWQLHVTDPIMLLKSSSLGEKVPRTKRLMTLIGCLALGGGYAIALFTKQPAAALLLFFVAVMLVILGTYCLFTAGSIALLKGLQRNNRYYYQAQHFISVSGMLYRMKRNAVSLANICILSTMVLVMLSSTTCLYAGLDDALRNQYPRNVEVKAYSIVEEADYMQLRGSLDAAVENSGIATKNRLAYRYLSYPADYADGYFMPRNSSAILSSATVQAYFIPLADYNALEGKSLRLQPGEVLVYAVFAPLEAEALCFGDLEYNVVGTLSSLSAEPFYNSLLDASLVYYFIVPDVADLFAIAEVFNPGYSGYEAYYGVDLADSDEEEALFGALLAAVAPFNESVANARARATHAGSAREDFLALYGGLFFLGIFLGLVFVMATVLIMYYKQITEGYEDRGRFEIMQKVGMSREEIKAAIRSQVLTVFFLPLITAGIHIAFAFPLITRLFKVLSLTNVQLFLLCTVISYLCFGLLYLAVYALTARTYYKIVSQ